MAAKAEAAAAAEDKGRSAAIGVLVAAWGSLALERAWFCGRAALYHFLKHMELLPSLAQEIDSALASFDGSDEAVRRALSRFRKAFQLAKVGCATI